MSKKLLFVTATMLFVIVVNSSRGQVLITNYAFSCGTTTYTSITGTPGPSGDDQTVTVSLPFTFKYIGVDYTQVSLCSNGWVAAGSTTSTTYVNALCNTAGDLLHMCPFWDDLYPPGGGNIQYTTLGSAPNRIWVAQWTNVNYFSGSGNVTMQIRLYEGSNLIEYIYGPCTINAAASGSIGMNDGTGGANHVLSVTPGTTCQNTTYSNTACNDNVPFTNLVPNLRYTFSPAPQPRFFNTAWCPPANPYPNIPAATIYNACAWIGDTLYMHSPSNTGAAATTVVRYSLSGNAWTTGVPLPVAKTQGTLTAAGTKLYYIGGGTTPGGAGSTDVYEYNPATGAWTLKAPLPAAVNGHGAAAWGDSVVFVIMGPWSAPTTNCYFYRIGSNTTGTTTAFTGVATRGHACSIWQNKIYVAGGFGSTYTKQFYIGTIGSDASTISWSAGPPFPSVPKAYLGGASAGDRFYVVGGNNSVGSTSSDSTFIWGISGGIWTPLGSLKPVAAHNIEAAVTYRLIGDTVKIFCPGGSSGTGTTLNFDVIACGFTVTGIVPASEIPKEYALKQNYPNPFNPTTNISFALPKAGNVKLVVYDLLGEQIAVLVNEYKHAGQYIVDFNAANLASGVYFYRIESGQFTDVKKMLLVK